MKKFTTKLLMSIIAVAFAFVALGTSTYAWFSMNTEVSASGLSITAKADETFLLISETNTEAAAIQGENKTDITLATGNVGQLLPVTYVGAANATNEVVSAKTSWKYAYSNNPDDAKTDATLKDLPANKNLEGNYVLVKQVYVTIAKDAQPAKDLVVSEFTLTNSNDMNGARVIFATSERSTVALAAADEAPTTKLWEAQITDSTVVTVNIYFYFEGKDATVKQTNLEKLAASLSFKLAVTTVTD